MFNCNEILQIRMNLSIFAINKALYDNGPLIKDIRFVRELRTTQLL